MSDLKPWQKGVLADWSICGMNHYHVNGEKMLFVSMVKDGVCITEEGKDDEYLWNRLWHKASDTRTDTAIVDECIDAVESVEQVPLLMKLMFVKALEQVRRKYE